jgi:hypothetical protein
LMANKEDKTLLSNVILALEFKMVKFWNLIIIK